MLKFKEAPVETSKAKAKKSDSKGYHFVEKVIKGETYLVMAQSAVELEDEYSNLYYTPTSLTNLFLLPPFEPNVLLNLVQTNNILNQCIEAMEVNIDGTGHEFVPSEGMKEVDKTEEKQAEAFFNEPYPNEHFVAMRRKLRRQMESVGYSYLEVIRNMADEVVAIRNIETQHVRMVKLDAPLQVKKKIQRDGKEVELTLWERERRFAQTVALSQHVYYREFGSTRHVHRTTGHWESDTEKIAPEDRGQELLLFGINPDIQSPYYLPRWINQLPSVIGSRSAEEQNLQFLDAGGMPPAIIFVQGGALVKDSSDQLRMYLSGMNKNKNRAVVVEVQSSSGSLDSQGKVDVKVERFGAEQSKDAMFMKYDQATEDHVRIGFRLPPLFIGRADDYNFATAKTSYMVAEAQVFDPERTDFDEIMNKTIIKALGFKTLKFKSKPITLKDAEAQLKGLELGATVATRESYLSELNKVTDMALEMAEVAGRKPGENEEAFTNTPTLDETPSGQLAANVTSQDMTPTPKPPPPEEKEDPKDVHDVEYAKASAKEKAKAQYQKTKKTAVELLDLAHDYAALQLGMAQKADITPERELLIREAVSGLEGEEKRAFDTLVAQYAFGDSAPDFIDLIASSR